ncbi:MAG: hypothetical protein RLZZ65_1085 [Bacteroidota bacterium]|jgi:hypothetical protein
MNETEALLDAFESDLFALKQRVYQSFDQVLLYPKFEKELLKFKEKEGQLGIQGDCSADTSLHTGVSTSFVFPIISRASSQPIQLQEIDLLVCFENLKTYQKTLAQIKTLFFKSTEVVGLLQLLAAAKSLHLAWYKTWSFYEGMEPRDFLFSKILDAQSWYQKVEALRKRNGENTLLSIREITAQIEQDPAFQHELIRLQKSLEKLSN